MDTVELLNRVAPGWAAWAVAGIFDATLLLGVVALVLLAAGKRLPATAAHVALLLVLAKVLLPIGVPVPRPDLSGWFTQTSEPVEMKGQGAFATTAPATSEPHAAAGTPTMITDPARPTVASISPSPAAAAETTTVPLAATDAARAATMSWQSYALLTWLTVSSFLIARLALLQWRLRRALDRSFGAADSLNSLVRELAGRLGIRRRIHVAIGAADISPAIAGVWSSTLIVPRELESRLSREQLEWVLLHELAHVRRGDLFCLRFQRLVESVCWFNPAVWLAGHWAEHYRECACDELALAHVSCGRAECGEAFVALLAGGASRPSLAMSFLPHGHLLKYRLRRLLDARQYNAGQRTLAVSATMGCVIAIGLVSFSGRPMLAAVQPVNSQGSVNPNRAAEATEDAQIEKYVRRIRAQQHAPMTTGRVKLKVLQLSSLQKYPVQQSHDLADRSKAEVEALLDRLELTDASCFRQIRDALLDGRLILDQPSYRSLELSWNEKCRRAIWENGETTIIKDACTFNYDPAERNASITDGRRNISFHSPADWARYFFAVPLRSTTLQNIQENLGPTSFHRDAGGCTLVEFRHDLSYLRTLLLAPDGTLRRATEQYEKGSETREIDFHEYAGGIVLPRTRVSTYYPQLPGTHEAIGFLQSLSITIIDYAEFNIDVPDSEFRMAVPANTAVWDRRGELKLRAAETATDDVLTLFER